MDNVYASLNLIGLQVPFIERSFFEEVFLHFVDEAICDLPLSAPAPATPHQIPVELGRGRREAVDKAIREVCEHRDWLLRAINVRTNHVHVVVSARCKSTKALNDFKAYSTRGMRKAGVWESDLSPWAEHGSRRCLWTSRQVDRACDYVINHQGDDLIPKFDNDDGSD
jgi:REP element-mobilizing transposase RayT